MENKRFVWPTCCKGSIDFHTRFLGLDNMWCDKNSQASRQEASSIIDRRGAALPTMWINRQSWP